MEEQNKLTAVNETGAVPAESDEAKLVRLANEINAIKEHTRKTVYVAMMDVGCRLLQAKETVGHGNWEKWLADNVDYSVRTAQRLIASFERFGKGEGKLFGREVDPAELAELNKTQILTLASIKDEEKCLDFIHENQEHLKDMTKAELEAAVKKLNDAEDKLRATETELEAARRQSDEAVKIAETWRKQAADLEEQLDEAGEDSEELSALKEKYAQLEENLKRTDQDAKEYMKLFTDSQKEIDKLQGEIKQIEGQPPTVVEKLPDETVREMARLKERIKTLEAARTEKSKEEKLFAHHAQNVKAGLEAALEELDRIGGEAKPRYAEILRQLLNGALSALESM